ncbi:hypothetical protein INT45_006357 [Circinella minor]|uniref:Heterokaryon incompatibility domain-containing protein n=1 Tax=Circinella minor TaxID=1195481 RepID=A0A8H7VCY8_9FUNG|nr:hypothetical protein INT45_006357 [Circinella minor]
MPYTTYHTEQWYNSYGMEANKQNTLPPRVVPDKLTRPEFMPTRLVRVSDMEFVSGAKVDEGYCAISYSWNWSGEISLDETTGESSLTDNGQHKIIFGQDQHKLVKFEGLIEQICRQFNIRYIWYDQMCINQDDPLEKRKEIGRIHRVYRNAYCTIALVPEFQARKVSSRIRYADISSLISSSWFKRMWTLEEVLLSSRVIVVGRNVHTWHDTASRWLHVGAIFEKPSRYNASTILHYAHIRDTTRNHDRVFALFKIYPDLVEEVYNYDDLTYIMAEQFDTVMIGCYERLANKDLSILCFGNYNVYQYIVENEVTEEMFDLQHYIPIRRFGFLPSWTGVEGEHFHHNCDSGGLWETDFHDYHVFRSILQVTCVGIPLHPSYVNNISTLQQDELPPIPEYSENDENLERQQPGSSVGDDPGEDDDCDDCDNKDANRRQKPEYRLDDTLPRSDNTTVFEDIDKRWELSIEVQEPRNNERKFVLLGRFGEAARDDADFQRAAMNFQLLSLFIPIQKENISWRDRHDSTERAYASIGPSFTEYKTDDNNILQDYILLAGIPFRDRCDVEGLTLYPVIRKLENGYYKAVGTVGAFDIDYFLNGDTLPPAQEYRIQ